jgi:hypothetical protein
VELPVTEGEWSRYKIERKRLPLVSLFQRIALLALEASWSMYVVVSSSPAELWVVRSNPAFLRRKKNNIAMHNVLETLHPGEL